MVSDNSSYFSEDSDRNITSDEDTNSDDWEDEEEIETFDLKKREVFGLKVNLNPDGRNNFSKIDEFTSEKLGKDFKWIRILIDNCIEIEHKDVIDEFISKIFQKSDFCSENLSLPLKVKITDKNSGKKETLIFDFQYPRGDEILLSEIPSKSKANTNSLLAHLYIYKCNEQGIKFNNFHDDPNVESKFGFKTWHKYTHL